MASIRNRTFIIPLTKSILLRHLHHQHPILRPLRTLTTGITKPGLFSLPSLHTPSSFQALANDAINRCNTFRQTLTGTTCTSPDSAIQILHTLDKLSNSICNVIDAAELCRYVHSDDAWRQSSSKAFSMLSEYISDLNSDVSLYETLKSVTSRPEIMMQLSEEERRMGMMLQSEFERDGIHLPEGERREVMQLQNHIVNLESMFSENIIVKTKYFDLPADEVDSILPRHILDSLATTAASARSSSSRRSPGEGEGEGMVTVSSDAYIANTLLKYSHSPSIRKEVYVQTHTACPENLEILDLLVRYRHQLSQKLGFSCYAERYLQDNMAKNQANVYKFLHQMSSKNKPGAKKEMEELSALKRRTEGDGTVHPWDIPFYTGLWKAQKHQLDTSSLVSYLSLENCLRGMELVVQSLFDIRMEQIPLADEERWCDADQPGIFKFQLAHPEEGPIGTLYLDLHPRPSKYAHAAHFTVRCGCKITETDTDQLPIVALVCNLSAPNSDGVALLSHSEVETLFHEFGHALHSLLSRTEFQHLSGTRAPVDYVETPSHLLEHFVWNDVFLNRLGKHHVTKQPIPSEAIAKLVQSRHTFRHIETQTQIVYSLLDQRLFGVPDDPSFRNHDTMLLFAGLCRENGVPYAEGTHWYSRFGHLVTYGAGYYGYLYSQVLASDIWKRCFEREDQTSPLCRKSGEVIWKEMLVYGGAKDPSLILRNVLGREFRVDSFLDDME